MRNLNTKDTLKALAIFKKVGYQDFLKKLVKITDQDEQGTFLVGTILDTLADNETQESLFNFLSGPYEMTPQEVGNLPLDKQIEMIKELINSEENKKVIKTFTSALGSLMR